MNITTLARAAQSLARPSLAAFLLATWPGIGATAQTPARGLTAAPVLARPRAAASSRQRPASAAQTRANFQAVAARLEFFDVGDFLYNRSAPADPSEAAHYSLLLGKVLDPSIPVAQIAPLCQDTDPKVRTLALAALFQREDAHLLPLMVALTGDTAPTFPGHGPLSQQWSAHAGVGPPTLKQTVGDVANAMVNFYLGRAGYHYGAAGTRGEPGFADYWAKRRERSFCASWFSVALDRASRGTSPTQPQYRADIRAVRRRINALPAADRDWTLLFLSGDDGSDALATEAELLAAARRRGADALLAVLRERMPSTDPDLQHRPSNDSSYQRLMAWILARAPALLRPGMADALRDCERWQRDYQKRQDWSPFISAAWPIAAARLEPKRGRDILRTAWARFQGEYEGEDRVSLMAALAAIGDARDYDLLSTWFFAPPPAKYDGTSSLGRQSEFFDHLPRQGPSDGTRQIVARLIADGRFDGARFWAVKAASDLVNAWSAGPVVDVRKLYETSWLGDENDPKALAALVPVRETLRRASGKWRG